MDGLRICSPQYDVQPTMQIKVFVRLQGFAPHRMNKGHVVLLTGNHAACYPEVSNMQCTVWHGEQELRDPFEIFNRHGLSFEIIIQQIAAAAASSHVWDEEPEGLELLQHQAFKSDHQHKLTLQLHQLIRHTVAVELIDVTGRHQYPSPLEVDAPGDAHQIQEELTKWGHHCHVLDCRIFSKFLCIDSNEAADKEHVWHYVFCHDDPSDANGCILHSAIDVMDETQIMEFLCQLGYSRAVIIENFGLDIHWKCVHFHHREPVLAPKIQKHKEQSAWAPDFGHCRTHPQAL